MADEEKTCGRRGEGEWKKRLETLEAENSELRLQLQTERQRHREWEESHRINAELSQVIINAYFMLCILYVSPEGSICKSHPWVLRFELFAIFIALTSAGTALLMFNNKICRRFVEVLKVTAFGFLMVAVGSALFSVLYFGLPTP